jgi:Bacterial protein of unknown function (DUF937)/OmpA family
MENLLEPLKQALGSDFGGLVSQYLGEPEKPTQTSIDALLPAILGGLFQKGCATGGAVPLLTRINDASIDASHLNNVPGLFANNGAGANTLVRAGEGLVNWLFGNKTTALATALAALGGIKSASATKLLYLAVPLVIAYLKKYIGEKRIDASSLASLLTGHERNLEGAIDNRLSSALGFSSPSDYLHCRIPAAAARPAAAYAAAPPPVKRIAWLPWLLLGLTALPLLSLCQLRRPAMEPHPVAQMPAAIKSTMAECGFPAKIYFEVGEAAIGPEGLKVINEAAACIKEKGLKVDLTGYTDKTGDMEKNIELAKNRSKAVQDALVADGVALETITLKPPLFYTITGTTGTGSDAEARRVEINKSGLVK